MRVPFLCLLLSTLGTAAAQRPAGWDAFVREFDAYAVRDSIVGAAVLVLRDGRVVARHDYGWADRELRQRADSNTIYHWGSITKTLTAVAILQLRDRGRLTLDDPITKYVPELRLVHSDFGPMDQITIRMLLSHSSGFQDPTWPWTDGEPWQPFEPTRWEQLVAMMPYMRLLHAPGTRYSYSNPGFIYLARVIEAITGDAWQTYVYKNIFGPLNLDRSYFASTPYHLAPYRSNNYTVKRDSAGRARVVANGRDFDPGITIPNGGWNAPLGDVATWVGYLASQGGRGERGEGGATAAKVVSARSLREMWIGRYPLLEDDGAVVPTDSMGLSFFVRWRNGTRFVGHTGQQAGFRTLFHINAATGAVAIAAVNTINDAQPDSSAAGFTAISRQLRALIAR